MLDAADTVLIVPHLNPDGDAIGSALAVYHAANNLGKRAKVVCHDLPPKNLRFLPAYDAIEQPDGRVQNFDLAVIVDVSGVARVGSVRPLVDAARATVVIDHHELNEERFDAHEIIVPDYAACALLVYDLFQSCAIPITKEIGQCVLTGIVTDTGNFRFPNTDAASLKTTADLIQMGCDLQLVTQEVFEKKPLAALKMLALALSRIQLFAEGAVVVSHLDHNDFSSTGALDEETESVVNEIGRVDTAKLFALFREPKPGKTRVSIRSRGTIDVSVICRKFGGGGHRNAAGCTFDSSVQEAVAKVVPALCDAVNA